MERTDDLPGKSDAPKERISQGIIPEAICKQLDTHLYTICIFGRQWLTIATGFCAIFKLSHTEMKLFRQTRTPLASEKRITTVFEF